MSIRRARESGLTLIEILIALAVLSIGLTGLAAMHLSAMQFVHSAHYRSLASTMALDLEERLWLELANNELTGCPDTSTSDGAAAAALIQDWTRSVASESWDWTAAELLRIPSVSITVAEPTTDGTIIEVPITLGWSEGRFSDQESTTESYTYVIRLMCRSAAT